MNRIINKQNDNESQVGNCNSTSKGSYVHNRTIMKNADITIEFSMNEVKEIEHSCATC